MSHETQVAPPTGWIVTTAAGLSPERTADPAVARRLVRDHGAAILTGLGVGEEAAVAAGRDVFAGEAMAVSHAAEVRAGGVMDQVVDGAAPTREAPLEIHTDGFAYGDEYPDHFILLCAQSSPDGGESFLVDGYRLLDVLASTPDGETLVERLESVPVEQTEEGMRRSVAPIIGRGPDGRRMVRRFRYQRASADSARFEEDTALVHAWDALCSLAAIPAPRFKLLPGEAAIIDNYRVMHGREAYSDAGRLMWRVWLWSSSALGVPAGELVGDSRNART